MKKFGLIALLFTLVLVGCGDGSDRQAKYLERAKKYLAEENLDKARIDASNVLQINPKSAEARLVLGDIHVKSGDIRKAYGMYQSVLEEDDSNVEARVAIVKLYASVRAYKEAVEHADKVLAVQPENAEIMGYKSVALVGLQQKEESRSLAEKALALDPGNSPALGVMTQSLVEEGDASAALEMLNKGQQANPDDDRIIMMKIAVLEKMDNQSGVESELSKLVARHPESSSHSVTLARYYIREGRFDDAEQEVRSFAEKNPDSVEAKRRVISYLQQHKSREAAIAQAEAYIESNPDQSEFYTSLAQLYLFVGEKEKGMEILRTAVDRDPRSVGAIEARNLLGAIHYKDKNMDKAKQMFDEVLEIEPQNEIALTTRAGLSLAAGEINDGIADLRIVLKNNPANSTALLALAQAQEISGSEGLALDNLKKLIALKEPDAQTLTTAARVAIKTKQYNDAEKFIKMALEKDAENARLVTNLIRLLAMKEDWDAAETFTKRLIDSEDSKALGYFLQSGLDLRLDKTDAAIANLKRSLQHRPEAVESLSSLAKVLAAEKGNAAAMAYISQHCEKYPKQTHCFYILGTQYAQAENYGQAEKQLKRSLELSDKLLPAYRQLAKVYYTQGKKPQVEALLKQGIDITDNTALRYELAGFYYAENDYKSARDTYQAILERDENALAAKNNLAMIYAENLVSDTSLGKARALIADLQDSENPAFLDTVGWVMYLGGDYEQAVNYLLAAVEKVGTSPLLQYHLGMAYFKSGDKDNARKHLQLATTDVRAPYTGYEEAQATLATLSR
ncbi:MAG: tetratricopeptide repeat protein [Gammaproteobacteria bacterium]|nr:tetratricopeptide repeat protein [Gammaproteobacteria bacterium]